MSPTADWRAAPCLCPLCLAAVLSHIGPVTSALAGTYVLTTTRASAIKRLCHPDGCPSDARAAARLASQETLHVPGAIVQHRYGDFVSLCDRVACARIPEQQQRMEISAAIPSFQQTPELIEEIWALLPRARRTTRPESARKLETKLLERLAHAAGLQIERNVPEEMSALVRAIDIASWQRLLDGACEVAQALPDPTVGPLGFLEGVTGPEEPFTITAAWHHLLDRRTRTSDILLWLLRAWPQSDNRVATATEPVTITIPGQALPAFGFSMVRSGDTEESTRLRFDERAAAWLEANVWQRWHAIHAGYPVVAEVPACTARQWWSQTYGDDAWAEFPEEQHQSSCRDGWTYDVDERWTIAEDRATTAPPGDLVVTAPVADADAPQPSLEIIAAREAFLRLCCLPAERFSAHSDLAQVADPFAQAVAPNSLGIQLDDIIGADGRIAERGELVHEHGVYWLRIAPARPDPAPTAKADPADLPRNIDAVLRRRQGYDRMYIKAWRYENVWGLYEGGADLSEVWDQVDPDLWSTDLDVELLQLLDAYGGFAPGVFVSTRAATYPQLGAAAAGNPLLASTTYARFGEWDDRGLVAALVYSRLRWLRRWPTAPLQHCPLCGDVFDPEELHLRDILHYGPPRWCGPCLSLGRGSEVRDADEALAALAFLAELLGTPPTHRWHADPVPTDLEPRARDRRMAGRMATPDNDSLKRLGLSHWSTTLAQAGLLPGGLATPRGVQTEAQDGHWCLSLFERAIDDHLFASGIEHDVQPSWPFHATLNPFALRRADWRLADGTMVEAAGMMEDLRYAAKIDEKRQLAEELGIPLLIITPKDLPRLAVIFAPWSTQVVDGLRP